MTRTRIRVPSCGRRLRSLTAAGLTAAASCGLVLLGGCDDSSGSGTSPSGTAGTAQGTGNLPSALDSPASAGRSAASQAASSAAAAASSFASSVGSAAGSAAAAYDAAIAKAAGQGNALDDVQLTGVPTVQTGGINAVVVTIVNNSGDTASYAVKIEFADSSGHVVDSSVVGATDVAAGETAQPVALTTKGTGKALFPRVAKAQRF